MEGEEKITCYVRESTALFTGLVYWRIWRWKHRAAIDYNNPVADLYDHSFSHSRRTVRCREPVAEFDDRC